MALTLTRALDEVQQDASQLREWTVPKKPREQGQKRHGIEQAEK